MFTSQCPKLTDPSVLPVVEGAGNVGNAKLSSLSSAVHLSLLLGSTLVLPSAAWFPVSSEGNFSALTVVKIDASDGRDVTPLFLVQFLKGQKYYNVYREVKQKTG